MNKIILAPTTLPNASPLEFIDAGTRAGYDALALRLNASPGLPFHPVLGDEPLIRDMKRALKSAPPVQEIGSFYMEPVTDIASFRGALALGASLVAERASTGWRGGSSASVAPSSSRDAATSSVTKS